MASFFTDVLKGLATKFLPAAVGLIGGGMGLSGLNALLGPAGMGLTAAAAPGTVASTTAGLGPLASLFGGAQETGAVGAFGGGGPSIGSTAVPAITSAGALPSPIAPAIGAAAGGAAGGIPASIFGETGGAATAPTGVPGAALPTTADALVSGGANIPPAGTSIVDKIISGAKTVLPAASLVGSNVLGSGQQADMLGDLNQANLDAYNQYLGNINPPKDVLDTRFDAARTQIRGAASGARRRISDTLASRGIRGQGVAAPLAEFETDVVLPAESQAFNQIFGQFNVPSAPGPANFAPTGGQLAGTSLAQSANQLLPLILARQMGILQ